MDCTTVPPNKYGGYVRRPSNWGVLGPATHGPDHPRPSNATKARASFPMAICRSPTTRLTLTVECDSWGRWAWETA
jgi:hypothetical protein